LYLYINLNLPFKIQFLVIRKDSIFLVIDHRHTITTKPQYHFCFTYYFSTYLNYWYYYSSYK